MDKMIKVRVIGSSRVREVTREEAQQILESISHDAVGGFVTDAKTGEVLSQIGPGVEEIVIVEQMLGGG